MKPSGAATNESEDRDLVAWPATYGELPAALVLVLIWFYFALTQGWNAALGASPLLLIGLALGIWTTTVRLQFGNTRLVMVVGPWRRFVMLGALESIKWKMTGGWMSRGTIVVRDDSGREVPVYVGRFRRSAEWGPLLLVAAARANATVDAKSRSILQGGDSGA